MYVDIDFIALHFWWGLILQKWKISCFKHEDYSSESPAPEFIEDIYPEELVKPNFDKPSTVKKDWVSRFVEVISFFTPFEFMSVRN